MGLLSLTACDGKVYYDESHTVDEHGWVPADSVAFDVSVSDTLSTFNFLMEVRNSIPIPIPSSSCIPLSPTVAYRRIHWNSRWLIRQDAGWANALEGMWIPASISDATLDFPWRAHIALLLPTACVTVPSQD